MQVFSLGVEVNSPGFLPKDLGERDVGYGGVCSNPFGEYHGQHVGIAQLRDHPVDTASTDSLRADQSHHGYLLRYHLAAEHPTPPRPPYGLLSPCCSRAGLCPLRLLLDRLRRFSRLLWSILCQSTAPMRHFLYVVAER